MKKLRKDETGKNKVKYPFRLYVAHIIICIMALFLTNLGKIQFGNQDQFSILSTFAYTVLLAITLIIIPIVTMLWFSRFEILCQIFLPNILMLQYSPIFNLMGICWYFKR